MADIYVDALVGDDTTGDGSSGNPYATIQKGVDESVSGDRVLVKASAPYGEAVHVLNKWITIEGYTSTVGDGGPAFLDGGGALATGIHFERTSGSIDPQREARNLDIRDYTGSGIKFSGVSNNTKDASIARNVEVQQCATGIECTGDWRPGFYIHHCHTHNNSVGVKIDSNVSRRAVVVSDTVSENNSSHGFDASTLDANVTWANCVARSNGGVGFRYGLMINCIADGNTSHGAELVRIGSRCLFTRNGGWGFFGNDGGSTRGGLLIGCGFWNNTSGEAGGLIWANIDPITMTANPYVDADNDDFNLNDAENGGQLLRDVSFEMPS